MTEPAVDRYRRARLVRAVATNAGYAAVIAVLTVGMVLVGLEYWRRGLAVFGAGTGLAAVLRATLPDRRQGLLRVRSRWFDTTVLAVAAVAILVVTWTISTLGTK
ncbi:hypothetical protein TPAU25S_01301 [Tsukamurella paurometabola]|uniref:DUF3017 domain-containing protein n=1 Tax=Tsukamurella paurometabola (strain ATCC 8368 / DSM 20162 / CCUG 35730 / CIP 100753 / JCM 10117 / KCTC 9821 / NBRC 16120 / NCIMB 702349 / NCTC 13040) TaxID=521096 RepID=D5UUK4_TSUPD|nr:DUF3017 domain-containing protein [Tsukamurella paurometabola]ADG77575.1 hypothetical protein Tpau_0942 [Tsukamurella paurometabola DSM 20162]SUP27775.1 Protein of uncharacterised function (DUF3017) [Tsukamurella paurometabola]